MLDSGMNFVASGLDLQYFSARDSFCATVERVQAVYYSRMSSRSTNDAFLSPDFLTSDQEYLILITPLGQSIYVQSNLVSWNLTLLNVYTGCSNYSIDA